MSCQTWIYKKVSKLTDQEKQTIYNKAFHDAKNWWGFKRTPEELVDTVKSWFERQPDLFVGSESPNIYAANMYVEYEDKLNILQNEGFDGWLRLYESDNLHRIYRNGELYVQLAILAPLRVFGYPSHGRISNKEELMKFLKTQDPNSYGYYDDSGFIAGPTDELESRIDTFFNDHEDDSILVEFG